MNIIIFAHPEFLAHQSMPRYAKILAEGMRSRGHHVNLWFPHSYFTRIHSSGNLHKWLGYVDQYIVFPFQVKKRLKNIPSGTLFVFSDHALGPWVPLVKDFPHIIHCHDFLAQRSAIGEIPQNELGWTGIVYQRFIKKGFLQGKYFISISQKTRQDLHRFLSIAPLKSEIVYNGLNQEFKYLNVDDARKRLTNGTGINLDAGYILHVGGNQFYKNRTGVVDIYDQWRTVSKKTHPLLLIGESPDKTLCRRHQASPFRESIHFLSNRGDEFVRNAYSGALVLLYPSIAEGFGWPIAEAMASGCPVITTNDAPMNEVAGDAAFLIPRMPVLPDEISRWAQHAGLLLEEILNFPSERRAYIISKGMENSKRFDPQKMLDKVESIYIEITGESL
jgi:glycosyltransferase involved in cell wall biosynthesis